MIIPGPEDTQEARELKEILCVLCYDHLIRWITGRSTIPYVPCWVCAPKSAEWLRKRQQARSE